MPDIIAVRMPKWGLAMQEGTIVHWWKEIGAAIREGEELVDIETPKITNVFESPQSGLLRRITANEGDTLPVGSLIGVMADKSVGDDAIDAFIAEFQANFVPGVDEDDVDAKFALSTVEAGGRTIRIGRTGREDGIPVLLIHGYSGDLNNWLFNVEALGAEHPVIAIDLPGHGGSSKDVGDGSVETLAGNVTKVLDALGITRAHIVGHSLGATVAARLTADNPDRVQSLVLIAPALLPGNTLSEEFLTGIAEGQRARDLKPYLEMLFADPSRVTKDMIDEMVKFKRIDGVEDALKAIRDKLIADDDRKALARDLPRIPRATVIASRGDKIVGAPDVDALPPSFEVCWIENAGHMPHLEKSGEVNEILIRTVGD